MKKVLIYGTMAVVCVTGMFALTGCSNKEESAGGEVDKSGTAVVETVKEIVLSDATDKWPSGVYDYYGLPEYTDGTLVYTKPNSDKAEVYYNTTVENFDIYLQKITAKGFRFSEITRKDDTIVGHIYDKEQGKGYRINVEIFPNSEVNINGTNTPYALLMYVEKMDYSEKNIQENLMTKFGLSNEDIMPKTISVVEATAEEVGTDTQIRLAVDFDSGLTDKEYLEYNKQIINACKNVAEDGKVYDKGGAEIDVNSLEEACLRFSYTYNGKAHTIYFCEMPKIGASLHMLVEVK